MTSRESFSSGHTVITHWKGGWKRTKASFPGGRCFISLLFSVILQAGGTTETNHGRRWKQSRGVLLFLYFCLTLDVQSGCFTCCDARAEAQGVPSTEIRCGQAAQCMWTPEWCSALQHGDHSSAPGLILRFVLHSCFLLLKKAFLCSTPRCVSKLSQRWTTGFDDGDGGKDAPSFSPAPQQDHRVKLAGGWCQGCCVSAVGVARSFAALWVLPGWVCIMDLKRYYLGISTHTALLVWGQLSGGHPYLKHCPFPCAATSVTGGNVTYCGFEEVTKTNKKTPYPHFILPHLLVLDCKTACFYERKSRQVLAVAVCLTKHSLDS